MIVVGPAILIDAVQNAELGQDVAQRGGLKADPVNLISRRIENFLAGDFGFEFALCDHRQEFTDRLVGIQGEYEKKFYVVNVRSHWPRRWDETAAIHAA